ncbi:SUN3 protein, partial [Anseranas semipalmata]|nr:SUN3 protein [Anseranas semipalmata]
MLSLEEQLHKLQEQLHHLQWRAMDIAECVLHEALKGTELPGFTGEAVQEIISQVLEKLEEDQAQMPDYACKSSGAAIIHAKTSPSFWNTNGKVFFHSLPMLNYVRSPEVILKPDNHVGNCWSFPGSQGQIFIKSSLAIIPRAVTIYHGISGRRYNRDSISSAPKDIAIYGLKEEEEEQGMFLGEFTFMAAQSLSQTFQVKNKHSGFINYVRLQVLSNWGNPEYTCVYRIRLHGEPAQDGD